MSIPLRRPETWNGHPVPYGASIQELEDRLEEPGPRAWTAMLALADHPGPEALQLLIRHARSPDWTFRRMAIEAISHHRLAHQASGVIRRCLDDASPYVVRTACQAVERLELHEAHEDLLGVLGSPDAATRMEAVRVLSALWQPEDYARVLRLYGSEPSPAVRREVARTLAATARQDTWLELFCLWKDEPDSKVRLSACRLAGRFGPGRVRADLETLAADRDGHVRKAAAQALQQLAD